MVNEKYYVQIKTGNTDLATANMRFLTVTEDGVCLIREFESKESVDKWIEKSLNEGRFKKTEILVVQIYDFSIESDFVDNKNYDNNESSTKPDPEPTPTPTPDPEPTPEPTPTPEPDPTPSAFNITVSKLAQDGSTHVPNDENIGISTANQNAIEVASTGDNEWTVNVTGTLQAFKSTNASQADADYEWIGLMVDTGLDDIKKVKMNGTLLTDEDVSDSESVGVKIEDGTCGSFILWLKAEALRLDDRIITLSADGMEDTAVTIKIA